MKKLFLLLCIIAMLSCGYALAEEAAHTMRVANCEEWVSLRESPDNHSERLAKVPVNACVDVYRYEGNYAYCCFEGTYGYIIGDYLEEIRYQYHWERANAEGARAFIREMNEKAGYEVLVNVRDEETGFIEGSLWTVANIAGNPSAQLKISHGSADFMIWVNLEDRHDPILKEVYAEAARYFATDDKEAGMKMYDELESEFEKEYRRNTGEEFVKVEKEDRIGRYFYSYKDDDGMEKLWIFMGYLD